MIASEIFMECTFDIKLGQAAKDGEVELLAIKGRVAKMLVGQVSRRE